MKTYREFIEEAAKRIRAEKRWHGTTKSRADSIKKSGFKGSEGSLGFGVYSTPFRKEAEYHARRQSTDNDSPALIQMRSFRKSSGRHHINARKMYDNLPSKDPLKRDISRRIKDRAQVHLKRNKDVSVTTITDKNGKVIGKETIQQPDTATKNIVKNPPPTIKAKGKPRRSKTQPKR